MKYMGSKARIAKHILPIILDGRKKHQFYVEPFVGGGNMIDKVDGRRIGGDADEYCVSALKIIKNDLSLLPTSTSVEKYNHIRDNKKIYTPGIVGYYGYALSYGGKFFGGWCRDGKGKRDYVDEAYRNAVKQSPKLHSVILVVSAYDRLIIPNNSIIYCDPPYKNTTSYSSTGSFNHSKFWVWCRRMSFAGHKVFVSEYNAPKDFVCLWEGGSLPSSLTQNTGNKKGNEKLFTYEV